MTKQTTITCANCAEEWTRDAAILLRLGRSFTTDCPHCGSLLMVKRRNVSTLWQYDRDGWETQDFHECMHASIPEWPLTGAGTGWVEL